MKTLIFLPTQGPHLPRTGPAEAFDWREQCRLAALVWRADPHSMIFVPSAFQQTGAPSELDFYGDQLRREGVSERSLILHARGLDTVEQCELALARAASERGSLIAITCAAQSLRVRYLLRGHRVLHVTAHGTPSRWLQFTNLVLAIAFPIIDQLGLREWWKQRLTQRRVLGKQ